MKFEGSISEGSLETGDSEGDVVSSSFRAVLLRLYGGC